jgi:NHL repeat
MGNARRVAYLVAAGLVVLGGARPATSQAQAIFARSPAIALTQPVATCTENARDVPCTPIAISGSGFGVPGSNASVHLGHRPVPPATGPVKTATIRSTDKQILVWNDQQIVIGVTSLNWFPTSVQVFTSADKSAIVPSNDYTYTSYPTRPAGFMNAPPPLAIAVDPVRRVFINEEFHVSLNAWSPTTMAVSPLSNYPLSPLPGIFAQRLFGDSPTQTSILGEDVLIDPQGTAWFTEGGALNYGGTNPNHSRILAYNPVAQTFKAYDIPGDNNEVIGIAWDAARHRMWFTSSGRSKSVDPGSPGATCTILGCTATAVPSRIVSFDPANIPTDNAFAFPTTGLTCNGVSSSSVGTCSNVPSRGCITVNDCVLAERICPSAVSDDSHCYHEYPLPPAISTQVAHMVLDAQGMVWYTAYGGGNYLGRLDPSHNQFTTFPLPPPLQGSVFAGAPWQIAIAPGGDIVFTEFTDNQVSRFDAARATDPACLALDANSNNPCIRSFVTPGPDAQTLHSLAVDASGQTWFGQGGSNNATSSSLSVGYVTSDWSGIVMFPPLSLYRFTSDGTQCGVAQGQPVAFSAAGVAVDFSTGDVWVADFCRKRLDQLHRIS